MASDKSMPSVSGKRSARNEDNCSIISNVISEVKLETPETETLELQSCCYSGNDCNTLDSTSNNQRKIVSNTVVGMNDIKKIKLETPELETANVDGNIQQMLQNQPLFKCSFEGCHYRTKDYSDFKVHQNGHQAIRLNCPFEECSDSFSHRSEFSKHIRKVHTKKSILSDGHFEGDYRRIHRIKNTVQDNPLSTIDSSDQEVVIAAGDIQVKLETPEQQILEFPSQSSHLKVHQDVHSDERPYQCSLCEKSFKTMFNLNIHQKIHKIQIEYSSAANSSTNNHNKLIRKETLLLSCDFDGCQFSTYKQGHLSVHLIRAHRTKNSFTETSFNQPSTIDANAKVGEEVVKTSNVSQVKLETPELETIELPSINSADCDQNSDRNSEFALSSSGSDIDRNDSDSEVVDEDCNDDRKDNGSVSRFECSFEGCTASFSLKNSLRQHVRIVHKKKAPLLRCQFEGCQYSTRRSSVFRTHRAVHSDERPYKCPHCELTFKTASNLWAHKKIHDEQPQFRCELEGCDYATHHSSSLCAHQKSIHERNGSIKMKRFQCQFDDCTASYSRKENLCAHIRIVHKKSAPLLRCDFEGCDYSTYKNKNMQDHRNVHQGIRFKCSFEGCTADYSSNASLLAHQQIVHEKKATLLRCDFEGCSFSTRRSSVFKVHQAVHSDERPYKCPHCDQSFKTASILWGHKRTHGEKPRYKCHWEGCDFTASLSANFREHLKSVHGTNDEELNGPRFECQFEGCTANYSTKTNLTKHVRIVHKKEAPLLRCQFDGCSFTTRITHHFKNHQTVHSDERPFKCPHCEQTYKTRANLWVHKKIHETKAANLKCDWEGCNFAAHKLSQLREHRQSVHLTSNLGTAGQRFQCNLESCSAKFSSRKQFNLHIRVVHTKEEPSST